MSFRVDQGVELRLVATILALNYHDYVLNQFLDGVIKFWGPREYGDPPVPIFNGILGTLLGKWGPLPTVQAPQVVSGSV